MFIQNPIISSSNNIEVYNKILTIVRDVANILKSPQDLQNKIHFTGEDEYPWEGRCLSHGHPGVCLLLAELSEQFPDEDWDAYAFEHLKIVNSLISNYGINNISLFSGLSGVGLAATLLSNKGTRYIKFISDINNNIVNTLKEFISNSAASLHNLRMTDYDVIQGVSGTIRYLLMHKENTEIIEIIKRSLQYLVDLTYDITKKNNIVPGWYISSENQFLESEKRDFPSGNFNTGMAHGIAGPLAILSIALMEGIEIKGQRDAIVKIASWLDKWKCKNEYGIYWSGHIKFENVINNTKEELTTHREAWCYGNPGISRALWLAGTALSKKNYTDLALEALESTLNMPYDTWGCISGIFCHGLAGMIHILNVMYADSGNSRFRDSAIQLTNNLLNFYSTENTFGFVDINYKNSNLVISHKPGLLDGAAGVLLPLLAIISERKTKWDSVFLLN